MIRPQQLLENVAKRQHHGGFFLRSLFGQNYYSLAKYEGLTGLFSELTLYGALTRADQCVFFKSNAFCCWANQMHFGRAIFPPFFLLFLGF